MTSGRPDALVACGLLPCWLEDPRVIAGIALHMEGLAWWHDCLCRSKLPSRCMCPLLRKRKPEALEVGSREQRVWRVQSRTLGSAVQAHSHSGSRQHLLSPRERRWPGVVACFCFIPVAPLLSPAAGNRAGPHRQPLLHHQRDNADL